MVFINFSSKEVFALGSRSEKEEEDKRDDPLQPAQHDEFSPQTQIEAILLK